MSFQKGWAALHLQFTSRVPRTEYSADQHWPLVQAVTGVKVSADSPPDLQAQASAAFRKAWHYDLVWSIAVSREEFGEQYTEMGHAVYAHGGQDYLPAGAARWTDPEQILNLNPVQLFGIPNHHTLVSRFNSHYAEKCRQTPEAVNMTGIYITLISGLIYLFGWEELLVAAGTSGERFGALAERYRRWIQPYFNALADAQAPVVMIHDDFVWSSGPFLHPDWYRRFLFPSYRALFEPLRQAGKIILFTSDGDYTLFIDDLVACGVNGLVMEPFTDMAKVATSYGDRISFIGNADTRVLLSGGRDEIRNEVKRCMEIGKAHPGFFMAVGNHIPANTPVDNALFYQEMYQELSRR
ncbi:MAG TPA: uroporphyrinogen decarboxylase family protein [bacterium]|nr:uroporphyrinogen decarboxylase family protein [bacterium]HPN35794.1 uroporphyrinogen decarboxylase family protein [bacterium]